MEQKTDYQLASEIKDAIAALNNKLVEAEENNIQVDFQYSNTRGMLHGATKNMPIIATITKKF